MSQGPCHSSEMSNSEMSNSEMSNSEMSNFFDMSTLAGYGAGMSKILSSLADGAMTFQEKSAITMTTILVVVFSGYFALVLAVIGDTPDRDLAYTGMLIGAGVIVTMLAATSHVLLALLFRSQASVADERDRFVALRSERVAGYVLALGVCSGIGLAMAQADTFWIAQALIASFVAAEVIEGIAKIVFYRRSA